MSPIRARGFQQKLQTIFHTLLGKPSCSHGQVILSWAASIFSVLFSVPPLPLFGDTEKWQITDPATQIDDGVLVARHATWV